ncbi:MAG: SOS response-associated peptidase [Verrucomicrobiae bacterium]|nr:SOS response-associated peptidase [Verrucomicrobiae bacterium]
MCARYTQIRDLRALLELVQCRGGLPGWVPRYNIAPTQEAPVIVRTAEAVEVKLMRWGFLWSWASAPSECKPIINARAETVRYNFKDAFARRRCLVPADGFYEWETTLGAKRPWRFTLCEEAPFCFAGLWEVWRPRPAVQPELFPPAEGAIRSLETFTIITTTANALVEPFHWRMPVILVGKALQAWLDPAARADDLQNLLQPFPATLMQRHPASGYVNRPGFEGPENLRAEES